MAVRSKLETLAAGFVEALLAFCASAEIPASRTTPAIRIKRLMITSLEM